MSAQLYADSPEIEALLRDFGDSQVAQRALPSKLVRVQFGFL